MMRYLLTIALIAVVMNVSAQNPIFYLLIGTYTKAPSKSEGIYVYKFNPNKAEATFISKATGIVNPSYLAITKDQKYVYAVNETESDNGGDVSAFSFDKQKGELTFINKPIAWIYFVEVDLSKAPHMFQRCNLRN